ncbi:hypothetical protein B0J18DRAFT_426811 [Chaetomium sp. MPI-SDFR-AT-0129]|nr:hypothetical protein B0J18DRAFT_426811 [Chaetomium sp. MPI-SDFR-AT-0129]
MADLDVALGRPEYWDEHYSKSDGEQPTHEWFRSFEDLEDFFHQNLFTAPGLTAADDPLILHLGSGDSVIPLELSSRGYSHHICADFAPALVSMMSERHKEVPGIRWLQMDVRDMVGLANKSVSVAFDKGTLDAMLHGSPWSPPADVLENTEKYMREVHRVLADDGVFLYITFRQPHFMRILLQRHGLWNLDCQVLGGHDGGFEYFGWVIRKAGVRQPGTPETKES